MITLNKSILTFLGKLEKNNNKKWFEENKKEYKKLRENFIEFVGELIINLAKIDPRIGILNPRKCIFRINRDVRFSKNKSPYKNNFGAFVVAGGKKNSDKVPGYYLHLEPNNCFVAAGIYRPSSPYLSKIRDKITEEGDELKKIVSNKKFKTLFKELSGDKLKTAPRGFAKDHPQIELLRYKDFLAVHPLNNSEPFNENFLKELLKIFKEAGKLNEFLYLS